MFLVFSRFVSQKFVVTIKASRKSVQMCRFKFELNFLPSLTYLEVAGNLANLFITSPFPILLLVYGPIFVSIRLVRSGNDCDCNANFCRPELKQKSYYIQSLLWCVGRDDPQTGFKINLQSKYSVTKQLHIFRYLKSTIDILRRFQCRSGNQ